MLSTPFWEFHWLAGKDSFAYQVLGLSTPFWEFLESC